MLFVAGLLGWGAEICAYPEYGRALKLVDSGGNVRQDIKQFGEAVAHRIDRIVQRKAFDLWGDPWTLQGIPLIIPGGNNGFSLGLKVAVQDIARQDPHKVQLEAQVLASDLGRYKHAFAIDYPHALGGQYWLSGRIAYDRDINVNYFGVGNDTTVNQTLLNQNSGSYTEAFKRFPACTCRPFDILAITFAPDPYAGSSGTR